MRSCARCFSAPTTGRSATSMTSSAATNWLPCRKATSRLRVIRRKRYAPEQAKIHKAVIASEEKQSILQQKEKLDYFAANAPRNDENRGRHQWRFLKRKVAAHRLSTSPTSSIPSRSADFRSSCY